MYCNTSKDYFYGLNDLRSFFEQVGTIVESVDSDDVKLDKIASIVKLASRPLNDKVNTGTAIKG